MAEELNFIVMQDGSLTGWQLMLMLAERYPGLLPREPTHGLFILLEFVTVWLSPDSCNSYMAAQWSKSESSERQEVEAANL